MSDTISVCSAFGGQAAARDIRNVSTIIHFQDPAPESKLQTEFAQRTGIWCPKPAREWLESLMENHRFTAKELAASWNSGSLGWDSETDRRKVFTSKIEALFAYSVVILMAGQFLASIIPWLLSSKPSSFSAVAAIFSIGMLYLSVCFMVNRFMLLPRRVALRVKRIELSRQKQ